MKAALLSLAVVVLVATAFQCRYSYSTAAAGAVPVLYMMRVDHWTGRTSVAWMMGNNCRPVWQPVD